MTWVDLSTAFPYGSKLTSAQMQNLRDNITALAQGDSGAPRIQTAALAADCVTSAKIATNAVTADAIAAGAVGASEIATDAVGASEIASGAVDTSELANYAVTSAKLYSSAVVEGKIASSAVVRAKLKTSAGNVSGTIAADTELTITMQDYCFFPSVYTSPQAGGAHDMMMVPYDAESDPGNTTGRFGICNTHSTTSETYAIRYRYVTSSDKPFIYAIQDTTGKIIGVWACEDPPSEYWGLSEKPLDFIAPLQHTDSEGKEVKPHKEHVIFNYGMDEYKELIGRSEKDKKLLHEMLSDDYEMKSGSRVFTRKNLSQI